MRLPASCPCNDCPFLHNAKWNLYTTGMVNTCVVVIVITSVIFCDFTSKCFLWLWVGDLLGSLCSCWSNFPVTDLFSSIWNPVTETLPKWESTITNLWHVHKWTWYGSFGFLDLVVQLQCSIIPSQKFSYVVFILCMWLIEHYCILSSSSVLCSVVNVMFI